VTGPIHRFAQTRVLRQLSHLASTIRQNHSGTALFCGAAALLLAFLFRDYLLYGRVLGQADFLFGMAPGKTHRPLGWRTRNLLLGDIPLVFYPFLFHARTAVLSGEFPLWSSATTKAESPPSWP